MKTKYTYLHSAVSSIYKNSTIILVSVSSEEDLQVFNVMFAARLPWSASGVV